jgi:hypothetical protein
MRANSKQDEALESSAFFVAGLSDPRFGMKRAFSTELRDALGLLTAELDALGLLDQYRKNGQLVAWDPEAEVDYRDLELGKAK